MTPTPGPELRDIHLPPPPGAWPLAVGWWVVIGVVLVAVAALLFALWRRHGQRRRAAHALAELDAIAVRWHEHHDAQSFAAALSQLLRRAARQRDARNATLRGEAWLASLQALAPRIPLDALAPLDAAIYRPTMPLDAEAAIAVARRWLRQVMARPVSGVPHA
jgi:hypothetical protein